MVIAGELYFLKVCVLEYHNAYANFQLSERKDIIYKGNVIGWDMAQWVEEHLPGLLS